jgi:RNA polymerase sigma-70 factor, ECF subfamily
VSRVGKPFRLVGALYGRVDLVSIEPVDRANCLEVVFRREAPRLWRALMAFTAGRSTVAEDAVAEAFSRAVAHSEQIRDPVAWLYRVAFRLAAEELRREPVAAISSADLGAQGVELFAEVSGLSDLFAALAELPPNQRAAVFLHYWCDLSVGQVAARLGVSRATARVHLWRGRARLRVLLGGGADE